jgi:hypothetical protein
MDKIEWMGWGVRGWGIGGEEEGGGDNGCSW